MSNSQLKKCLKLVTAEENLICPKVLQLFRKENLWAVFPKVTIILNIYMNSNECEAKRKFETINRKENNF
jgi:hypothetical protein